MVTENEKRRGRYRSLAFFFALLLSLQLLTSCVVPLPGSDDDKGKTDDRPFSPSVIDEVTADSFSLCYGEQLSPNEKAIYDAVCAAKVGENIFDIELPQIFEICRGRMLNEEEQDAVSERISFWTNNALYAAWLDEPLLYWLDTGNYRYTYEAQMREDGVCVVNALKLSVAPHLEKQEALLCAEETDAVLRSLDLRGGNDVETVRNINDYLCDVITYTEGEHQATVYGALVNGTCVCEGYAHAFALLCRMFDIDCTTVVGEGVTDDLREGHMWNAVLLDGVWYAVDVTWNDTTESDAYLLTGALTEAHGATFEASHIPTCGRGNSKTFAQPLLSKTAYEE